MSELTPDEISSLGLLDRRFKRRVKFKSSLVRPRGVLTPKAMRGLKRLREEASPEEAERVERLRQMAQPWLQELRRREEARVEAARVERIRQNSRPFMQELEWRREIREAIEEAKRTGRSVEVPLSLSPGLFRYVIERSEPSVVFRIRLASGKFYSINERNYDLIMEKLRSGVDVEVESFGSDDEIAKVVRGSEAVALIVSTMGRRPEGGLFPYYHNYPKLNLSRYGVYHEFQSDDVNCLIMALRNSNLGIKGKVRSVTRFVKNQYVARKDLGKVADLLGIQIHATDFDQNMQASHVLKYGSGSKVLKLGCFEKHWFLIEEGPCTLFALKHYAEVSHLEGWEDVYKFENGKPRFARSRRASSTAIIRELLRTKETSLRQISGRDIYRLYRGKKFEEELFEDLNYDFKSKRR
ncbi:MAG: hypothetical protein ACO35C_07865, partial [Pontimonas sp.]